MEDTIVIAASLAQKPRHGGHTWAILQYLLGFRRLGWNVLFLDHLDPAMCVDAEWRKPCAVEQSLNLRYLRETMEHFGLGDAYSLVYNRGERFFGVTREQVIDRTRRSAFLLNVMGFLTDEDILGAAPRRVFLDIDPGFGQMWRALGLHDLFAGHDDYVTIAENIGQAGCAIPTCGLEWIATRQPVVLEHWQPCDGTYSDLFTSVASWRGAYGPVEYQGRTYGLRVHEFRKFFDLPRRSGQRFQLALDIHPADVSDLTRMATSGWSLVDPKVVASDPWTYRAFIQNSKAEFGVAKNMYVQAASGWFSDRSICYLASGKPVLVQDTGLAHLYPTGRGLVTFATME